MTSSPVADCPPPLTLTPAEVAVFRRPPVVSTYDWARTHVRLVTGPYKGQLWRPDITPYARGIMDAADRPETRKIFIIAPSQCGKTTVRDIVVLAREDRRLTPAGIGMSGEQAAKRIFTDRLVPMIRAIPSLRAKLSESRFATEGRQIDFCEGSAIYAMWAGAESSYSSVSMELVCPDEEDIYEDRSAVRVMEERCNAYLHLGRTLIIRVSRVRGTSETSTIWRDATAQAQCWYHWEARCPACNGYQVMDDKRIVSAERDCHDPQEIERRRLGRYECEHCGYLWTDQARNVAVRAGRWRPDREVSRPTVICYHLRTWESVLVSLSTVLGAWFEATHEGDPVKLRTYDNGHRSVPFNVITRETPESQVRARIRPDMAPQVVPAGALALTCGVDRQQLGDWFIVRAWAASGESWLVDQGWLATEEELERQLFATTYPVQGLPDVRAPIYRSGIDIGGGEIEEGWSATDQTVDFLQRMTLKYGRAAMHCRATKGASREQAQAVRHSEIGRSGNRKIQFGALPLYTLDTVALKDRLFSRIAPDAPIPWWIHAEAQPGQLAQYIRQLTAETKIVNEKTGKQRWEAKGRANHLLDCEVIAMACADPLWTPSIRLMPEPWFIHPVKDEGHPEKPQAATGGRRLPDWYTRRR